MLKFTTYSDLYPHNSQSKHLSSSPTCCSSLFSADSLLLKPFVVFIIVMWCLGVLIAAAVVNFLLIPSLFGGRTGGFLGSYAVPITDPGTKSNCVNFMNTVKYERFRCLENTEFVSLLIQSLVLSFVLWWLFANILRKLVVEICWVFRNADSILLRCI